MLDRIVRVMGEKSYPRIAVQGCSSTKQVAIRTVVGLALGIAFAIIELGLYFFVFDKLFHDLTHEPAHAISLVFGLVNAPAEWLCYLWRNVLQMPPRGEVAWVVVPVAMMLLQWGAIGLLAGLVCGLKSVCLTTSKE